LANRAVLLIADRATAERLKAFAREINERLRRVKTASLEPKTQRRAELCGFQVKPGPCIVFRFPRSLGAASLRDSLALPTLSAS